MKLLFLGLIGENDQSQKRSKQKRIKSGVAARSSRGSSSNLIVTDCALVILPSRMKAKALVYALSVIGRMLVADPMGGGMLEGERVHSGGVSSRDIGSSTCGARRCTPDGL